MFDGALPETQAERDAFAARRPCRYAVFPTACARSCPRSRVRARTFVPLDGAAHRGVAVRRRARLPAVARHRRARRCTTTRSSTCAVVPTLICRAVAPAAGPRTRRAARRARLRRELPVHDARRGAGARARGRGREVPHLDDRPRLQRVDVHRARDHVDRCRPRRRGRRRDRRALGSAARRRAEPRTPDARRDRHAPTAPSRGCATRSSAAIA